MRRPFCVLGAWGGGGGREHDDESPCFNKTLSGAPFMRPPAPPVPLSDTMSVCGTHTHTHWHPLEPRGILYTNQVIPFH